MEDEKIEFKKQDNKAEEIAEAKLRIREQMIKRRKQDELMKNKIINAQSCVFCKVCAGVGFGFASLYFGKRTQMMWGGFQRSEKIFNLAITGLFGFASLIQFYASLDTYKSQNLIPLERDIVNARSQLFFLFASPEEKRQIVLSDLDEAELVQEVHEAEKKV
ncbi:unnamed protein product [Moneuplotes crassus]|uniref:Transmembrane protein n=1 Tax=Euplotes crassus TaxID=5936 RepID=A0AAD1Y124_EUPCR|nr:unnamed protein product [Moneuplotes crassus]